MGEQAREVRISCCRGVSFSFGLKKKIFQIYYRPLAIEHIEDLLADRRELLSRLNLARNSLARGHPLLALSGRDSLWERPWTGGEGAEDDEDEEDE